MGTLGGRQTKVSAHLPLYIDRSTGLVRAGSGASPACGLLAAGWWFAVERPERPFRFACEDTTPPTGAHE